MSRRALARSLAVLGAEAANSWRLLGPATGAALAAAAAAAGGTAWAAAPPVPAPLSPAGAPAPAPAPSNDATAQWRVFTDVGRDLVRQGRRDEAEAYFVRALEAARRGFGPRDPHVASACQNLAELYRLQRRYDEAAPLYESALAVLAEAYGPADVRVAFALHNLAGLYVAQRQYDAAAERYEQALQVKRATVGPGHSETSNTTWHLAEVRWAQGRRREAAGLAAQAVAAMEQQGVGEAACARRRTRLAEMLLEEGRPGEAEPLLRRVLDHAAAALGEGGGGVAGAAEALARAVQARGGWDEARGLLQRAVAARRSHPGGGGHPATAGALRRLAELELAALAAQKEGRPAERAAAQLRAMEASAEAVGVAERAYADAQGARAHVGAAPNGADGGWLAGLWPWQQRAPPAAAAVQRSRPGVAALEMAHCLRTRAAVLQGVGEPRQAAPLLQRALGVLGDAWPEGAAAPAAPDGEGAEAKVAALRREARCAVLGSLLGVAAQTDGAKSAVAADVRCQLEEHGCPAT
jgi:tetratricopeptide (TPR) repeat protein